MPDAGFKESQTKANLSLLFLQLSDWCARQNPSLLRKLSCSLGLIGELYRGSSELHLSMRMAYLRELNLPAADRIEGSRNIGLSNFAERRPPTQREYGKPLR